MLGLGLGLTAWRRPAAGTILLGPNFLSPLLTFARASGATDTDAAGNIVVYGENVPRYGYDLPTGLGGWLLEGASTNLVRNPRGEGAVVGVAFNGTTAGSGKLPTNWTVNSQENLSLVEVTGFGTENGLPYVELHFVTTGDLAGNVLVINPENAPSGVTGSTQYALSWHAKAISGTVPPLRFGWADGMTTNNKLGGPFTVTNTRQRVSTLVTSAASATTGRCGASFQLTPGVTYDFTVRLYSPQLEQNYYASSLILPPIDAPAVATRAADSLSILGPAFAETFGTNAAQQGCMVAEFMLNALPPAGSAAILHLDAGGSSTNRRWLQVNAAGGLEHIVSAGASVTGVTATTKVVAGTVYRAGARWLGSHMAVCLNGEPLASRDDGLVPEVAPDSFRIGRRYNLSTPLNGRILRVLALPYAPSDTEFQALCTPGVPL